MGSQIVLYGNGLFGRNLPASNRAQLKALKQSGFTTVILWTLHVDTHGTLVYNDTPIAKDGAFLNTFDYLPDLIADLTTGGSVQNVLFSIGSWGVDDFQNVQTLLSTSDGARHLKRNFSALAAALPIGGFDFDDESLYSSSTDAQLTEILCGGNTMIVTYCPYANQSAWNGALQQVYGWDQQQNPPLGQSVQWWNLQCYAGGGGNQPLAWAKALPTNAGIADPQAFIVPGFSAAQTPAAIQKEFAQLAGTGITGGFIWNSSAIFSGSYTPQQYAQAIIDGLASTSAAAASAA